MPLPVVMRAEVGRASLSVNGVRTLELDQANYIPFLKNVSFSDETASAADVNWYVFPSTGDFPAEAKVGDMGFSPDTKQIWKKA